MSTSDDFEAGAFQGKVLGDLEALRVQHMALVDGQKTVHECIDRLTTSIEGFKLRIGERVGENEKEINDAKVAVAEIKVGQGVMGKLMWLVGAGVIASIVGTVMSLILKTKP